MNPRHTAWTGALRRPRRSDQSSPPRHLLGVLKGEGVGPEVTGAAVRILEAIEESSQHRFEIRYGGAIGKDAEKLSGEPLPPDVVDFCSEIFAAGGAVLAGPGGGRFVYDSRRRFDLFCKISPLQTVTELANAGRMKPEHVAGIDCLLLRDNVEGIYQGAWHTEQTARGRRAVHQFDYNEDHVRRLLEFAAEISSRRSGILTVIHKDSGIPTVSELWIDVARSVASKRGIELSFVNVDYAAYLLVQDARGLDVIVSPNLMGDILADVGAVVLGSRALSYSGNFGPAGESIYQTNHGAGYDIAGTNAANPAGQIYSLCMLLIESFGLIDAAARIESAMRSVWRDGWRTADIPERGCRIASTSEITELICETIVASQPEPVA